jgi:hypothetical protein
MTGACSAIAVSHFYVTNCSYTAFANGSQCVDCLLIRSGNSVPLAFLKKLIYEHFNAHQD